MSFVVTNICFLLSQRPLPAFPVPFPGAVHTKYSCRLSPRLPSPHTWETWTTTADLSTQGTSCQACAGVGMSWGTNQAQPCQTLCAEAGYSTHPVLGCLQTMQRAGEHMDPDILNHCEVCKEMNLSKRFSKRVSYNVLFFRYILNFKILMVFNTSSIYPISGYNRDLKYQYNPNSILNLISAYSATQATQANFDWALKLCLKKENIRAWKFHFCEQFISIVLTDFLISGIIFCFTGNALPRSKHFKIFHPFRLHRMYKVFTNT